MRAYLTSIIATLTVCFAISVGAASIAERYVPGPYDQLEAGFVLSEAESPPVGAEWETVRLPHLWGLEQIDARSGWYRFLIKEESLGPEPYAVYFWRFSMNIAVWLNDEFLGDGGKFSEPISRNWNRPFLFMLPRTALNQTEEPNYLYVHLGTYPKWGNLAPPMIAPMEVLQPIYKNLHFWQINMSQATFYVSIITAVVAMALFAADTRSRFYLYFALSCLAWSMYSLNLYVQEIPMSAKVWWNFVHSSVDWYGVTLALFAHRLVNLQTRVLDRLLVGFGVLTTLTYWLVSLETLSAINSYFHFVSMSIAAYLMVLCFWKGVKTRALHVLAFSFCCAIIVGFGAHDLSMNAMVTPDLWQHQFFWLQFSAPILMITMLTVLAYRFVLSYRQQVNAEQQIRTERERIFTDIHDDVGSKVLSLVYSAENNTQAELARDALREIRAIVAGGTSRGGDLSLVLATYEAEARQRFEEAGIALAWTENLTGVHQLSDTIQYHLQRVIRELVSNTIKHAHADKVEVLVQSIDQSIQILVRDFGCGLSNSAPGTGMSGVERRVTELGGTAIWQDVGPGCRVEITLPLNQQRAT